MALFKHTLSDIAQNYQSFQYWEATTDVLVDHVVPDDIALMISRKHFYKRKDEEKAQREVEAIEKAKQDKIWANKK